MNSAVEIRPAVENGLKLTVIRRFGLLIMLSATLNHAFAQEVSSRVKIAGVADMEAVYSMLTNLHARWNHGFLADYAVVSDEEAVKQVSKRTADFAVVDTDLPDNEREQNGLLQFPTMTTAIVPVINLPGVKTDQVVLTAAVLGDIMSGVITNWHAKKIRDLNPTVPLPDLEITCIVRPETSGASQSYTTYLGRNSSEFSQQIGTGPSARWPARFRRARDGNDASEMLVSTPGAISYVEMGTANRKNLSFVRLRHRNGNVVKANLSFLGDGVLSARMTGGDPGRNITADLGVTWPILLTSYVVMAQRSRDDEKARSILRFFFWQLKDADPVIQDRGLVPLPPSLQARSIGIFRKLQSQNGKQWVSNFDFSVITY